MINLVNHLDERLWTNIRKSWEDCNYTGAIQESFYLLSSIIRERSGLEGDGHTLIGKAFGTKSPKLKLNRLQTASEKDEQKGFEQFLRGLYTGIRNPRSHDKYNDSMDDAIPIILFINYIIKRIDHSRAPFSKANFLTRISDQNFVQNNTYCVELVNEIPAKNRFEIFCEVYRIKEQLDFGTCKYFLNTLLDKLNAADKKEIYAMISEEMKTTDNETTFFRFFQIFPAETWPKFDRSGRIRVENKAINSVREGKINKLGKTLDGSLGTWITGLSQNLILKDEFNLAVFSLLYKGHQEQKYVFKYVFRYLMYLFDEPDYFLTEVLVEKLREGNVVVYQGLSNIEFFKPDWKKELIEAYSDFVEQETCESEADDEEFPFLE